MARIESERCTANFGWIACPQYSSYLTFNVFQTEIRQIGSNRRIRFNDNPIFVADFTQPRPTPTSGQRSLFSWSRKFGGHRFWANEFASHHGKFDLRRIANQPTTVGFALVCGDLQSPELGSQQLLLRLAQLIRRANLHQRVQSARLHYFGCKKDAAVFQRFNPAVRELFGKRA